MNPMLHTAIRAARTAGKHIIYAANNDMALDVEIKDRHDFVTQVDKKCESIIIEILHQAYPYHNFLGEESGETIHSNSAYCWVIDPLDGTTNFIHKFPMVAISIALQINGQTELAVIYNPFTQDLFTAERGRGSSLNDRRIRVSDALKLDGAFITAMVPKGKAFTPDYESYYAKLQTQCAGVRRSGSCALDLAYVASGTFDAFWTVGPKPWDLAAGLLLIQEAGGQISYLDEKLEKGFPVNGALLASNFKLTKEILPILKEYYQNP
jgi:myo-inositol-1(or 4)-monophosphatase